MRIINLLKLALPGLIVTFLLSFLGLQLAALYHLMDALFLAFLGAVILGSILKQKSFLFMGIGVCKDILIPVGLFLYGTQVGIKEWGTIKFDVFSLAVLNLAIYFVVIFIINRYLFRILNNRISFLNGGANAICGVSATAVFIPFIDAKNDEVTMTLISIVVTGLVSVFATWFLIQPVVNLPLQEYAEFCGLTLNQTGLVKAAAGFMSHDAVNIAITVKNFRTSMIIPVALLLMFLSHWFGGKKYKMPGELRKSAVIYGVFIAFLFFGGALLFTFTPLSGYTNSIKPVFKIVFGMTLASVGLLCNIRHVSKTKMILNTLSSIIAWVVVAIVTLTVIKI